MEQVLYPDTIRIENRIFDFSEKTFVMGILNTTPDSFFDGGKYLDKDSALYKVEQLIKDGADFIDIGGESTRPGSIPVTIEEEIGRVIPVVIDVKKNFDVVISVDTTKAEVAKEALDHGASIINDISGLSFEPEIADHVSNNNALIILMHTTSRPIDMQQNAKYDSLIDDITDFLNISIEKALSRGVKRDNIIIDPGIGFGKTVDNNIQIIRQLRKFGELNSPILIGTSRKSFIGKILDNTDVEQRLIGSVTTAVLSGLNGASIVRVHDVKETVEALKIAQEIYVH